jgi:hypothetical protein
MNGISEKVFGIEQDGNHDQLGLRCLGWTE